MVIATFCLLFIAVWLFFNGLNEKRWVDTHRHDETVAADEGFLPSYSAITTSLTGHTGELPDGDGQSAGRTMAESKQAGSALYRRVEHRLHESADALRRSARDEDGSLNRLASKAGQTLSTVGHKVGHKVGEAKEFVSSSAKPHLGDNGAVAKAAAAVKARVSGSSASPEPAEPSATPEEARDNSARKGPSGRT